MRVIEQRTDKSRTTMVAAKCQSRSKVVIDRSSQKFQIFLEAMRNDRCL